MNQAALKRETFTTSRLLDFFSVKELTAQIGHAPAAWPLVVLKELVDNTLDACEEAGIPPFIEILVDESGITVTDNGPGLPAETVQGVLDFAVRVSSREAYVSPTRGAQGNALKTIVAMPFALDGETGSVTIEAQGVRHSIACAVDRIRQVPVIRHQEEAVFVRNGTCVKVAWPNSACSILREATERFLQVAQGAAFLNPHLTLGLTLFGDAFRWEAADPQWVKWKPSDPTPPHWYDIESLSRLIAAYIAHDSNRTVREFISEFRGLSSTAKQKAVLDATGLARQPLTALMRGDASDNVRVEQLLDAMRHHCAPVKPAALGVIGKDNLHARFQSLRCDMDTFKYAKKLGFETDGLPSVTETAFAWCPQATSRALITGVNWSPGILNPFRELGRWGKSLDSLLEQLRSGRDEPTVLLLHMACPRVRYSDRGKSVVVLED